VLGVETGLQTTVAAVGAAMATGAAVAAVAGNSTRVTADEGDGNEGKEHSNRESEKTLHHIPPIKGNLTRHAFLKPSEKHPIRDGHRTAVKRAINRRNPGRDLFGQPAALPCKR
jgi:hypothetical protein